VSSWPVGRLDLCWDGWAEMEQCYFVKVVPFEYLAFVFATAIVFPSLLLSGLYARIYWIIRRQIREKRGSRARDSFISTSEVAIFCLLRQEEANAAMKLGILVLAFILCWMPLYTINTIQAFRPDYEPSEVLMHVVIVLSHANSVVNPILYACHLTQFRRTMWITIKRAVYNIFCCWNNSRNPHVVEGI